MHTIFVSRKRSDHLLLLIKMDTIGSLQTIYLNKLKGEVSVNFLQNLPSYNPLLIIDLYVNVFVYFWLEIVKCWFQGPINLATNDKREVNNAYF